MLSATFADSPKTALLAMDPDGKPFHGPEARPLLPLIKCVVVSDPALSSRKTIATISWPLMCSPSFSTRTNSAIKPPPPLSRAACKRPSK
jgi:hypothetical protein